MDHHAPGSIAGLSQEPVASVARTKAITDAHDQVVLYNILRARDSSFLEFVHEIREVEISEVATEAAEILDAERGKRLTPRELLTAYRPHAPAESACLESARARARPA